MKNSLSKKREEKYFEQLGLRLRHFRKLRGYTNYEYFAYEIHMSRTQYGKYEKGANIQFSTLLNLLKALNVSLEEFFSDGFDQKYE